jgi:hypothetical protein
MSVIFLVPFRRFSPGIKRKTEINKTKQNIVKTYIESTRERCSNFDRPEPQGSIRYLDAKTFPLAVFGMATAS